MNHCTGGGHQTVGPVRHCQQGWEDGPTWSDSWCTQCAPNHVHLGDLPCGLAEDPPNDPPEETEIELHHPFAHLIDSGLLWLINRTVFHPRGYAVSIHLDSEGNAVGWSLMGDGDEPWSFAPEMQEREHELFRKIRELMP